MLTTPKSDPNELNGRTLLLRSRPEQDMILSVGLATLIGAVFCIVGLISLIWWIIDEWPDIFGILFFILLLMLPVLKKRRFARA